MAEVGSAYVSLVPSAQGFGSKMESSVKPQVEKSGHSLGLTFGKVFAAVGGALIAHNVGKFIADSTAGYRDHLKVVAQTNAVIKSTGAAANVSANGVDALTTAIEQKTGIDGDAIASGANLLLTFTNIKNGVGKSNQVFDQATRTITDMGVALGTGPEASAIQLGKALNDPIKGVGALSRVGVTFTEQQKKQIGAMVKAGDTMKAQKVILAELSKEFGGSAKAAVTPAAKAQVAYHALQDEVGKVTVPVMNRLWSIFANKVAPVLLNLARTHLPAVRKALLGLLDGNKVGHMVDGLSKNLKGIKWGKASSGASSIGDAFKEIDWKGLQDALGSGVGDTLTVFGVAMKFAAKHASTLAKYLPLIVAAFIAYKGAQTLARAAAIAALPVTLANAAANVILASSNRKLAGAMTESAVASGEQTVANEVGLFSKIAQTAATIAYAVASGVATAATWLLNAAIAVLTSPITLVVVGILLLIGGLVLLYKKSDTFRAIVNAAWDAVKAGAKAMWDLLVKAFHAIGKGIQALGKVATWLWDNAFRPAIQFIVGGIATLISIWAKMLHGLGHVPGFGWATAAGDALQNVADKAQAVVDGIEKIPNEKHISITTDYRHTGTPSTGGRLLPGAARGARVVGGHLMLVGEGHEPESIVPDSLMTKALTTAAIGGAATAPSSGQAGGYARNLRLVVDGYEFNAYVDSRADDRVSSAGSMDDERGRASWR